MTSPSSPQRRVPRTRRQSLGYRDRISRGVDQSSQRTLHARKNPRYIEQCRSNFQLRRTISVVGGGSRLHEREAPSDSATFARLPAKEVNTNRTMNPQQLAYAPTPYSYTPSANLTATTSLDKVRCIDSQAQDLTDANLRSSNLPRPALSGTSTSPSPRSTPSSSRSMGWKRPTYGTPSRRMSTRRSATDYFDSTRTTWQMRRSRPRSATWRASKPNGTYVLPVVTRSENKPADPTAA